MYLLYMYLYSLYLFDDILAGDTLQYSSRCWFVCWARGGARLRFGYCDTRCKT